MQTSSTNLELKPLSELKRLILDNDIENEIVDQLLTIKFGRKNVKSNAITTNNKNSKTNNSGDFSPKTRNDSGIILNNSTGHGSCSLKQKLEIIQSSKIKLRIDDNFLKRFITTDKNDPEKALKRYKAYYKTILLLPSVVDIIEHDYSWFCESTDFMFSRKIFLHGTNMPFGIYGCDKSGRVILGFQCELFDLDMPNFEKYVWYGIFLLIEFISTQYETVHAKGYVFVGNYKGFSYRMITKLATPTHLKILNKILNGSIPASAKNIFLYGEPYLLSLMYKMSKPFLGKKADRIVLVGTNTEKIIEALGGEEYTPNFITGGKVEPIVIPGQNVTHGIEIIEKSLPQLCEE